MDEFNTDLEFYNTNGYLVIDDVFKYDEVSELLDEINSNQKIQEHIKTGNNVFGFHYPEITTISDIFYKYSRHKKLIELIRPILGEDIQLHHSKLTVKTPIIDGNPEKEDIVPWHQDFAHFPHTNTSLLAVMICLVDFNKENGCMQMIPGSHKWGVLSHRDEDGTETIGCNDELIRDNIEFVKNITDITPKKGGISIHHCLTLHSSQANIKKHPRYSLVYEYRSRDAYQLSGKIWKDTGLVISGKCHKEPIDIRLETLNIPLLKSKRYHHTEYGDTFNQYSQWSIETSYSLEINNSIPISHEALQLNSIDKEKKHTTFEKFSEENNLEKFFTTNKKYLETSGSPIYSKAHSQQKEKEIADKTITIEHNANIFQKT